MCGICGVYNFDPNQRVLPEILDRMNRKLAHRGPDASGAYFEANVGIAAQRLSIVDVENGNQPIPNEDQTIWVVCNGEIYNHVELREFLENKGHHLRTKSDTEVIVHLYEEVGIDLISYLRGMFAFALWVGPEKKLFLARDRFGIKPLYYSLLPDGLLFASEIKSLLSHPHATRELDLSSVINFLRFGTLHGTRTLFKNVHSLSPGCFLTISGRQPVIKRYWDLRVERPDGCDAPFKDQDKYVSELRALMAETVKLHCRSDVPIGVYLSGGLDSSSIVSYVQDNVGRRPIPTYNITFQGHAGRSYDESFYAQQVSSRFGTRHKQVVMQPVQSQQLLKVFWHPEAPSMSFYTSLAFYELAKAARQDDVKVILSGEGADEIFGGYLYHTTEKIRRFCERVPNSKKRHLLYARIFPNSSHPDQTAQILKHYSSRANALSEVFRFNPLHLDGRFQLFTNILPDLLSSHLAQAMGSFYEPQTVFGFETELLGRLGNLSPFSQSAYIDVNTRLVDFILLQADKMSMANSVEIRVPFLDHRLVEFAFSMPERLQINGINEKYILKKAMRGRLPDPIIQRRKKAFLTPWITNKEVNLRIFADFADTLLSPVELKKRELFNERFVQQVVAKYQAATSPGELTFYLEICYRVLVIQILHHLFIEGLRHDFD